MAGPRLFPASPFLVLEGKKPHLPEIMEFFFLKQNYSTNILSKLLYFRLGSALKTQRIPSVESANSW